MSEQLQDARNLEEVYEIVLGGIIDLGYSRARLYIQPEERYLVSVKSRGMGDAAKNFDGGKIVIDLHKDEWFKDVSSKLLRDGRPLLHRLTSESEQDGQIVETNPASLASSGY